MFVTQTILYNPNQTNTMETNWIILAAVLVGALALIIYLIVRNKKDEEEVMKSFNAEDNIEGDEAAQRKGEEWQSTFPNYVPDHKIVSDKLSLIHIFC